MFAHRWLRRTWLVALLAGSRALAEGANAKVDVWIDLSEPVPAEFDDAERVAMQRQRVERQQHEVAQQLRRLGAVELARARHTRNAIAVRIDGDRLDAVRRIEGVQRVRPTETLHPPELLRQGSTKNEPR